MATTTPHQRKLPALTPPSLTQGSTTAMDTPQTPLLRKVPVTSAKDQVGDDSSRIYRLDSAINEAKDGMDLTNLSRKTQWIIFAVASGACAAFNGVFAKLTTTELTTSFAAAIARFLGLGDGSKAVEIVIRAMFFGLNLIFNGVMWTLFTKALARGTSTTQVSIINTSSNFMITAILGFFIFTESLPPLWWLGAALLVAGNVIIGRREEKDVDHHNEAHATAENGRGTFNEEESLMDGAVELVDETEIVLKKQNEEGEEDDMLDLGDLETGDEMTR